MSIPRTIIDKIWDAHVVRQAEGHPAILAVDLHLIHEVTTAQAFDILRERGLGVFEPHHTIATLDHSIPTDSERSRMRDPVAKIQVNTLRDNVRTHGIPLLDFGSGNQGIVHVIGPELGLTQPAMTIVCGDSHTSTHGAFGALAFGIGTSEVALVLATGCVLQYKPKTMNVHFTGTRRPGVFAKDMILALIAKIGIGGANGHVMEYTGDAIRALSMEERMTICNMSIEAGARAGLIAPDETTFSYLEGRRHTPSGKRLQEAITHWSGIVSDAGAPYDKEIEIDVSSLEPMVTWGTNPGQCIAISGRTPLVPALHFSQHINAEKALTYVGLTEDQLIESVPIDWAFLGSCTNARLSDLRIAATMLKGKKIHPRVTMYVVPGSERVKSEAEAEGLDKIFLDAGAKWRNPGCSSCLGMNEDKVPAGSRAISSSNRNFVGRQGPGSITHLASPATVVASALAGAIASPLPFFRS